jgi:hypothetical protein
MRGGDLVGAYLITRANPGFPVFIKTPHGDLVLSSVRDILEAVVGLELGELCANCFISFRNSHRLPEVLGKWGSDATSRPRKQDASIMYSLSWLRTVAKCQHTISASSLGTTGSLLRSVSMSILAEGVTEGNLWNVTGLRCYRVSVSLAVGSPD